MDPYVDERLKLIYKEAMEILREHQKYLLKYNDESCLSKAMYPINEVIVNSRSKSRRGCCKYNGYSYISCSIEISEYMLKLPEVEILTTMIHELLHTFKDSKGHGGSWAWRASYLKEQTGLNIQRCRSIEGSSEAIKETNKVKPWMLIFKCERCDHEVVRSKNSRFGKHPEYYRCSCGGSFKKVDKEVSI